MKHFSFKICIICIICNFVLYGVKTAEEILQEDGLYATIETEKGDMLVKFEFKKTPLHVCNFVGLAEGTIKNEPFDFGEPYFDGLPFHRVAFDRVIQSGDPPGPAQGPGYQFHTEIDPTLKHDRRGAMGMALMSPGSATAGSQWYITHLPLPELDGDYTVFGYVVDSVGLEVIMDIRQGDLVNKVTITRVGIEAEKFKTDQETFDNLMNGITEAEEDIVPIVGNNSNTSVTIVQGHISIRLNNPGPVDASVYATNGREIFSAKNIGMAKNVIIPFSGESGMYILRIKQGNETTTYKFVMQEY